MTLKKCSKIDFSSSGSEFSLIALASAERHDSTLYFGLNCFSSDLSNPSWMRKKFRMLLICEKKKFNFCQREAVEKTYAILVFSIVESLFEQLLSNGFSFWRLFTNWKQFEDCKYQMSQISVFRCGGQNFLKSFQLVIVFNLVETI